MLESVLSSKQGQKSVDNLVEFLCVRSQSFRRDNATVKGIVQDNVDQFPGRGNSSAIQISLTHLSDLVR